jgi:hypothetical protein
MATVEFPKIAKVASLPLVVSPHFRPQADLDLDLPCGHQGMVVVRSLFRGKLAIVAKRHLSDTMLSLVGKLGIVAKSNIFKTLMKLVEKVKMVRER